jgi:hypothetical protein
MSCAMWTWTPEIGELVGAIAFAIGARAIDATSRRRQAVPIPRSPKYDAPNPAFPIGLRLAHRLRVHPYYLGGGEGSRLDDRLTLVERRLEALEAAASEAPRHARIARLCYNLGLSGGWFLAAGPRPRAGTRLGRRTRFGRWARFGRRAWPRLGRRMTVPVVAVDSMHSAPPAGLGQHSLPAHASDPNRPTTA